MKTITLALMVLLCGCTIKFAPPRYTQCSFVDIACELKDKKGEVIYGAVGYVRATQCFDQKKLKFVYQPDKTKEEYCKQ